MSIADNILTITNEYGNTFNARDAADFMAQHDQRLSDLAWDIADTDADVQAVFDEYCRLWLEEYGEEFLLATQNPQW